MPHWPPQADAIASPRHMLRGGPPVERDELEQPVRLTVELAVLWHGDVLSVSHLPAPGVFHVGRARSSRDVALPAELLGTEQLRVAVASSSEVAVVLRAGARGWLTLPDGSSSPLDPGTPPSPGAPPTTERLLPLGPGQRAHLSFGAIEVQVAPVPAGRAPARLGSSGVQPGTLAYFALSVLTAGGLLSALSLLARPLGLSPDERGDAERLALLHGYLAASDERARALEAEGRSPPQLDAAAALIRKSRGKAPPPGLSAEPEWGDLSFLLGRAPAPPAVDSTPRERELEQARHFGVLSILKRRGLAEANEPRRIFHRELGGATEALMQDLFNPVSPPLEAAGPGGLALSGTGQRGGSKTAIRPLGPVRTAAEGEGSGVSEWLAHARPSGSHRSEPEQLRSAAGPGSGELSPSAARRAVNAQFPKLRACREAALAAQPPGSETTVVRFVVQSDGRVEDVSAGPELPASLRGCIERVFRGLHFAPTGTAPVPITYPIDLAPRAP